jgi:predicted site-specific integrase-resolvase
MINEQYLNTTKAAKFLGVSNATLRNWDKQGILIPEKTIGDHRRYALSVLQNYYNNKNVKKLFIFSIKIIPNNIQSFLKTIFNFII